MALNTSVLDNPIWNALSSRLSQFSVGGSLARRFDFSIGPLAGLREQTPEAYGELATLLKPGETVALFLDETPRVPSEWSILRQAELVQMVCPGVPVFLGSPNAEKTALLAEPLTPAHVPEMVSLVQLTEPGPFGQRTIELGSYLGIWREGKLAAMAGQRLAPEGFTEVSAVCTHPEFRGLGYAQFLVARVAQQIQERGETPFLTSLADNLRAIRVYESVGFVTRRTLQLVVITPKESGS